MALRNSTPLTFRPRGCSDATDGTSVFPGAMQMLANLIPDNAQNFSWVPRPAAVMVNNFSNLANAGFISGLLVVGDTAYGTIANGTGNDLPFALNLATNAFLPVNGVLFANTPASPPTSGAWIPPIIKQVGSRIIVCHPGFPGGAIKFGWFDISGFTETTTGNTNTSTLINGNPSILGVQPGMTISGAGIPANTTVVSTANFVLVTTGNTHTNTTLDGLGSVAGVVIGQTVAGAGIQPGTTVAALPGGSAVTLSLAATATATGVTITFGGATITMSAASSSSTASIPLTIAGGTTGSPLWGAGDTDRNNLPNVPLGVEQFNGRAYYVLGVNGIVYSDSGFPCRVSNTLAVQALTTNDGLASTVIAPLMLSSPLLGGIVQSLIVFEGPNKMQQITGDQTTGNLAMNALPVATGTLAPLSVVPCELGTAFVSPQGLRIVNFSANVTPPIGDAGAGITDPFVFSAVPSRICLAANADILRITSQNGKLPNTPQQDWWYDVSRQSWCGSHTFPSSLAQPWRNTFLIAPIAVQASLWQSDAYQSVSSSYVENGANLSWAYIPTLLPDNQQAEMNAMVETTVALALAPGQTATVSFIDDVNILQDTVVIQPGGQPSLWGTAIWGSSLWGGSGTLYRQRLIEWHLPLVFKQGTVQIAGQSGFPTRIGNVFLKYEVLKYVQEYA